ncbi:hypothetical protein [Embleya sp. AB8]|uniref:hypothetical protein n=1 Tax=Embleya sp. AB8 TaxID=3156304 RepID=UPI003C791779
MSTQDTDAAPRLAGVVRQYAQAIASALDGGGDGFELSGAALVDPEDPMAAAAVRVLGADVLAPCLLAGKPPASTDLTLVERAVRGFPPGPTSPAVSVWSHWGLHRALERVVDGAGAAALAEEPDAHWVSVLPWQAFAHRSGQLAALADPLAPSALSAAIAARPVDLARGFVRAVRRQDWQQAAGVARWLALAPDVPESLGLDAGSTWIEHAAGKDARVALQLSAARATSRTGRA